MSHFVSDTKAQFDGAYLAVSRKKLPIQGDGSFYNETQTDLTNQAMMYVAMIAEEKMTREDISKNIRLLFDKPLQGSTTIITVLDLLNKGLVNVIKPDDPDASERQREERIFLYELA